MVSWTRQIFIILSIFGSLSSYAHISMRTQKGRNVEWKEGRVLNFAGNPRNNNRVSDSELFSAVTSVLDLWQRASGNRFQWDYWQGTDLSIYEANSNYNGQSSIYFTSQSGEDFGWEVIGKTEVWYDTKTGEIFEADIALNDRYYPFVGTGAVDLTAVLTHEMGHALGLTHTGVEDASLYPYYQSSQAALTCDDRIGAQAQFDGVSSSSGVLEGRVELPSGSNVFGAHVRAFSVDRSRTYSGTLSDKDGSFRLEGLPEGDYIVTVEAFQPGESALTEYYHGLNVPLLCTQNGTVVLSDSDFQIGLGSKVQVGTIALSCETDLPRYSYQTADSMTRSMAGATRYPSSDSNCAMKTEPVEYQSPAGDPPRSFADGSGGWCSGAESVRYQAKREMDFSWLLVASIAVGQIFRSRKKPC